LDYAKCKLSNGKQLKSQKQKIMKQVLLFMTLLIAALFDKAVAQDSIFTIDGVALPVRNTGNNTLIELNKADSIFNFNIAVASFPSGKKLDWHYHPGGQILLITDGIGYYQEKGKPKKIVSKGKVIKCLPGVEHWHSASVETGVTYLAASPAQKGATVWLQKVTDEEYDSVNTRATNNRNTEQEIINLSKQKWQWMADKNVDSLSTLFHEKSMFVHMGGSWGKTQEINVIKDGTIWYKKAEVYSVIVNIIGNTVILLNDIDLVAVVGGNEVINPFMVTEVYVNENGKWRMGSLTFSKLMRPVKMSSNK
jgi:4-carboxymuconolactone decarboxylase